MGNQERQYVDYARTGRKRALMPWPIGLLTPHGARHKLRDNRYHGTKAPMLREVIHIDPAKIAGELKTDAAVAFARSHGGVRGLVEGGDWDLALNQHNPRALGVYLSCHAHWIDGVAWSDTLVYKSYLRKIAKGKPHPDCPTHEALDARYRALDLVFASVRDSGRMSEAAEDLVTISLNRHGQPYWGPNGRHRVCIALVLGLEQMPARVGLVHTNALDSYQAIRSHRRAQVLSWRGYIA